MTTSDRTIIEFAFKYGHFHGSVSRADLDLLTIWDKEVVDAVQSYQEFMSHSLDSLTHKYHGRKSEADGVVGPATRELFAIPRCDVPDFGVGSAPDGSGSWPMPCQKSGVKFSINKSGMPQGIVNQWPAILADVLKAYADVGLRLVEVPDASQANIVTTFTWFIGFTIGVSEFNQESCSDRPTSKLSNSYVGYNRSLIAHEWGHCCNLSHTRGGIMNPSILPDPSPFTWAKSDPSYPTLARYFGGVPLDSPNPPPVVPPVTPSSHPFLDFLANLFKGWF